jgi:hypothetical protein
MKLNGGGNKLQNNLEDFKDVTIILPLFERKSFERPKFETNEGIKEMKINKQTVRYFIKIENKWYARMDISMKYSLLLYVYNKIIDHIFYFELPNFQMDHDNVIYSNSLKNAIPLKSGEVYKKINKFDDMYGLHWSTLSVLYNDFEPKKSTSSTKAKTRASTKTKIRARAKTRRRNKK